MNDPGPPRFDEVMTAELDETDEALDLVVHRYASGIIASAHTPLERGPVRCDQCETPGNRVYVKGP